MTALKHQLDDWKTLSAKLRVIPLEPTALRAAAAAIDRQAMGVADLEAVGDLQDRVAATIRDHGGATLSRRDLREGCKAFLLPPTPLGRDPDLRDAILVEVCAKERRAAFFALIDAYIDAFQIDDPDIRAVADRLDVAADRWPWREEDHWPAHIRALDLFDPVGAPERVARAVMDAAARPLDVLTDLGLGTAGRIKGGLVEAAFQRACALVRHMRRRVAANGQERLLAWARDDDGGLAYPRAWPELADACLAPWSVDQPEDRHKTYLIDTLERFGGGDPRTRPERWRVVADRHPDAYATLLRWLTKASVLQFLDIVDQSMKDAAAKRMWAYRKAFWTSYIMGEDNESRIDAAWVAFGDEGARLATRAARETGDRTFAAFGRQHDKSPQHAALVMRMGDLTIVEWSHNAKYNVWLRGDRGHPPLFKQRYELGELYSAPLQESHVAPANYSWQKRLAQIIEGRTFWSEKPAWRPHRV